MNAWDPAKHAANLAKHGIAFELAEDFAWATALVRADVRHGYGEVRLVALGAIGDRLHSLTYTVRKNEIRLISLRVASRKEEKAYESQDQA